MSIGSCSDFFPVRTVFDVKGSARSQDDLYRQLKAEIEKVSTHCEDQGEGGTTAYECLSADMPARIGITRAGDRLNVYFETTHSGGFFRNTVPSTQREGFALLTRMLLPYGIASRKVVVGGKEYAVGADFDFADFEPK